MAKTTWKGGALIAPLPPVMVTCSEKVLDKDGNETTKDNIITVAWTGIVSTTPPKTYISVRPGRFSHHILKDTKEFVINLASSNMAKLVDYCGIYTGAKVDKFEKCGFSREKSEKVACPSIAQCKMAIECRVTDILPQGSHDMFLADIVAVRADEKLIDENGKLELEKADLLAFAHGEYFKLGEKVGDFGFSARREHSKGNGKGFEKYIDKKSKAKRKNSKENEDFEIVDFNADELFADDVEVVEIIVPDKNKQKSSHLSKSANPAAFKSRQTQKSQHNNKKEYKYKSSRGGSFNKHEKFSEKASDKHSPQSYKNKHETSFKDKSKNSFSRNNSNKPYHGKKTKPKN